MTESSIEEVLNREGDALLKLPNVVRVEVGDRRGEDVIRVFVSKKVPRSELATHELIPRELDGYGTDVVEIPEPAPDSPTRRESFVKMIEYSTKALALFALLSYSLGLVITNTYLYYAGVSEFELFRPRFVTTGFLALALLALSGTGIMAIRWAYSVAGMQLKAGAVASFLAVALAAMPLILMWFVLRPPEGPEAPDLSRGLSNWKLLGIYSLGMAASGGFLLVWSKLWPARPIKRQTPTTRWAVATHEWVLGLVKKIRPLPEGLRFLGRAWLSLALAAAFVLWILLFSKQVFNRLPEQFGGTHAKLVQLLIDESAVGLVESTGIDFGEGYATCRVGLLFHGSDFYLVRRQGEEHKDEQILLAADVVRGLVIDGPRAPCPDLPQPSATGLSIRQYEGGLEPGSG